MFNTAILDCDILDSKPWIDANGYLRHGKDKYVHRTLAEHYFNIVLKKTDVVHHIDRNKQNNTKQNLMVLNSQKEHIIQHAKEDIQRAGGHYTTHYVCSDCKILKELKTFNKHKSHWNGYDNVCRTCKSIYKKKLYKEGRLDTWNWKTRLNQQYRRIKTGYNKKRQISWL